MAAASLAVAFQANAVTIKMGADNGGLVFEPSTVTVKAGETITCECARQACVGWHVVVSSGVVRVRAARLLGRGSCCCTRGRGVIWGGRFVSEVLCALCGCEHVCPYIAQG